MISLLDAQSFNSCIFESSSFRATQCASSLFRRSFFISDVLELLNIHVTNPGNHPETAAKKTSNRVGFPKAVKLPNRTDSQHDWNLGLRMTKMDVVQYVRVRFG